MRHSPSRRTILAGLIVSVLLMPTSPATAVMPSHMRSALLADATPSEVDAIRFRSTFGLESSLAFVAPLQQSRLATRIWTTACRWMRPKLPNSFGGRRSKWQSTPSSKKLRRGIPCRHVSRPKGRRRPGLHVHRCPVRSEQGTSGIVPAEFGFRVQLATRTYDELTALNERIVSSWDALKLTNRYRTGRHPNQLECGGNRCARTLRGRLKATRS